MNRIALLMLMLLPVVSITVIAGKQSKEWPRCGSIERFPAELWAAADAETLGWDRPSLDAALAYLDTLETSGVMVVHEGLPVVAWGDVATPRMLASLRKSVLSGLIGAHLEEGPLGLGKTLAELGIDDADPPLTPAEKQATWLDLLGSRSGIVHSSHYETGGWKRAKEMLRDRGGSPPGSTWIYNNWDFNAAAHILERETGEALGEGFARRVAAPIGMQDFTPAHVKYVGNESYAERSMGNLSEIPAFMFAMSVRDLARFGLLYLNCGEWADRQVLSREWVLESIRGRPIADNWPNTAFFKQFGDYGYLWWVDKPGSRSWSEVDTAEPVYIGQGAHGHNLWIAPYLNLVVVHQVATPGGLGTFDQIRRRVFGQPSVSDEAFMRFLNLLLAALPVR